MWLTSISGIFNPHAKPLANQLPTNKEPNQPGPFVKAMAFNWFNSTLASCKA